MHTPAAAAAGVCGAAAGARSAPHWMGRRSGSNRAAGSALRPQRRGSEHVVRCTCAWEAAAAHLASQRCWQRRRPGLGLCSPLACAAGRRGPCPVAALAWRRTCGGAASVRVRLRAGQHAGGRGRRGRRRVRACAGRKRPLHLVDRANCWRSCREHFGGRWHPEGPARELLPMRCMSACASADQPF